MDMTTHHKWYTLEQTRTMTIVSTNELNSVLDRRKPGIRFDPDKNGTTENSCERRMRIWMWDSSQQYYFILSMVERPRLMREWRSFETFWRRQWVIIEMCKAEQWKARALALRIQLLRQTYQILSLIGKSVDDSTSFWTTPNAIAYRHW